MCKCAECGTDFKRQQAKQTFCSPPCKTAYHNRSAKRGKTLVPLMMAWRTKRGGPSAKQAFVEGCRLISLFAEEDKAAGRMSASDFIERQHKLFLRG